MVPMGGYDPLKHMRKYIGSIKDFLRKQVNIWIFSNHFLRSNQGKDLSFLQLGVGLSIRPLALVEALSSTLALKGGLRAYVVYTLWRLWPAQAWPCINWGNGKDNPGPSQPFDRPNWEAYYNSVDRWMGFIKMWKKYTNKVHQTQVRSLWLDRSQAKSWIPIALEKKN